MQSMVKIWLSFLQAAYRI